MIQDSRIYKSNNNHNWKVKVSQSCLTLCDPMVYTIHGILQVRILEWVAFPSPGDFPNQGIEPRSPALQADSLPAEPQGKPKNTGVGSLSLLQGIFLIQESNRGFLHCRWILYHFSYKGSPSIHRYTYIPYLLNLPPISLPSPPL